LEDYIESHFAELFPGWSIYDDAPNKTATRSTAKQSPNGRQYHTKAGVIDILCKDTEGNLVVIELKRDRAPDKVLTQVAQYMEWVKRNLKRPNQGVRGLVIARSVDGRLQHALPSHPNIEVWLYDWHLELSKWIEPEVS
jgi:endonuclease